VSPLENAFFYALALVCFALAVWLPAAMQRWIDAAVQRRAIQRRIDANASQPERPMRRLMMPFLAGGSSLIIIAVLSGPHLFPRWSSQEQLIGGLVIGVLATVVLYAIMRAIAERSP
jgi:hypothetical protein